MLSHAFRSIRARWSTYSSSSARRSCAEPLLGTELQHLAQRRPGSCARTCARGHGRGALSRAQRTCSSLSMWLRMSASTTRSRSRQWSSAASASWARASSCSRARTSSGLTTASGLWIAAGIGMAAGAGFYVPAFMATLPHVLFIFEVLWHLERKVKKIVAFDEPIENIQDKP